MHCLLIPTHTQIKIQSTLLIYNKLNRLLSILNSKGSNINTRLQRTNVNILESTVLIILLKDFSSQYIGNLKAVILDRSACPTQFILNNSLMSFGLMATNFVDMSLFTDPMGDGKFTREWTVFYWLWWISYAPGVALFVTRVSKGRTIKEVIFAMVIGGSVGLWFIFGVFENYSVYSFIHGAVNVPQILSQQGGEVAIGQLLSLLPAGKLMMWIFLGIMVVFLAAHMDAVGYAVSATCTRGLSEGQDPSPNARLFWCVMLTLVPIAMIFSKAPLDTMKTATIVTALPFIVIILIQTYGLVKWLIQDYAKVPSHLIEQQGYDDVEIGLNQTQDEHAKRMQLELASSIKLDRKTS